MDPEIPTVKPAWLTTEFWLTVIPVLLFLYKMLTGKEVDGLDVVGLATLAASFCAAAYAISRALQKRAVIMATALLQDRKMAISHDNATQVATRQHEAAMTAARYAPQIEDKQWSTLEDRIVALEARLPKPRKATSTSSRRR